MASKRFFVAIPTTDGAVELNPMKEWLRHHRSEVPPGMDPTYSTSHQLRDGLRKLGWTVQEGERDVRLIRPSDADQVGEIAQVFGSEEDDQADDNDVPQQSFALERHLRDFLAENLHTLTVAGRKVRLFVDQTGRDGIEYPTEVGLIDLLAVDDEGAFVVFELKRASVADRAVGQLARYMGWVKHTIGRGSTVRGVIIAKSIDNRLRFAASVLPDVSLFEYSLEFRLNVAHELPNLRQPL